MTRSQRRITLASSPWEWHHDTYRAFFVAMVVTVLFMFGMSLLMTANGEIAKAVQLVPGMALVVGGLFVNNRKRAQLSRIH